MAKFLETIGFREWVLKHVPAQEYLPNANGVYENDLNQIDEAGRQPRFTQCSPSEDAMGLPKRKSGITA
ncbi:MAG: hypothetical protein QME60_07210 [Verrucomicrobiota bacterium]|nr:hypothetical protein [Verrucomicrobiota bacterium]